ncbi:MAG: glycosyltransferase family 39 protein [Chloroflexota bacterium]
MITKITEMNKKHLALLLLVVLGCTGAIILWINTSIWGIGVGYDSYFYLSAADNFLAGNGFSRYGGDGIPIPIVHFPPAYPLILAATNYIFPGDAIFGARILAVILLGLNIVIIGWLIYTFTESVLASLLGTVTALLSPFLLEVHLMAMTEPIFLATTLLMLYVLSKHVQNPTMKTLTIASILAGISFLIRYAGATSFVVGVVAILVFGSTKISQKIKNVSYFVLISLLVISPWLIRNWVLTRSITNRSAVFHFPGIDKLLEGINVAATWISPTLITEDLVSSNLAILKLSLVVAAIILGIIIWVIKLRRAPEKLVIENHGIRFVAISSIYIGIYILFLFVSLALFDASIQLSNRILSPIYVITLTLGIIAVWQGYSIKSSRILTVAGIIGAVLFLSRANFDRYQFDLDNMRESGKVFTGREWQNSETINVIHSLPSELNIFTNEPFAVYILTGRITSSIPEKYNPVKREANSTFEAQMELMMGVFRSGNGALILFDSYNRPGVYASEAQITRSLILWRDTADGSVYIPEGFEP